MATKVTLICKNCNKIFIVNKGKEKETCSKECKLELRAKKDEKYYINKICKHCGNVFRSKRKENKKYCSYECAGKARTLNSKEKRICKQCGCEFEERKKYNKLFCSDTCRLSWQKKPENIKLRVEKSKNILLKKYGVDSIFKNKEVQNKIREKNKNNENITTKKAQEAIKIKREKKLIERFKKIGYEIIEFKNNNNLLVKHPDGHIFENNRKLLVNRLNHNVELSTVLLPVSASRSTLELLTTKFLDDLKVKYSTNNRKLVKGKEFDIVIEEFKLCIELNGLFWHSELYLNKNYHIKKLNNCNDIGYSLLNFFEDEINEKFDIVKSIIRKKINLNIDIINSEDYEIKEITNNESNQFLIINDLKKPINSKIRIGLFYKNKLTSIMLFKKIKNNNFEILRFCELNNVLFNNSTEKLLKYFIENYKPSKIITYTDNRYEDGSNFINLNFIKSSMILPKYWYVLNKTRKEKTYRHKFKLPKIYDCGSIKYELNL